MGEWAADWPGSSSMVPAARQWVRVVLKDWPDLAEDMALIASEYVTNSVRHSRAAEGEPIHMRIIHNGDVWRIEVEDGGTRTGPESGWTAAEAVDFGRGLTIVARIADVMGDETTPAGGRLAWAEMKR